LRPFTRLDLGTAAILSPVNKIGYQGLDLEIPVEEDGMGPVSRPIWAELVGRQTGEIESDWSVVVHEEKGHLSRPTR
jgi:branched-chain amino acid aminotransferase